MKAGTQTIKLSAPIVLIAIAVFLAVLIGGFAVSGQATPSTLLDELVNRNGVLAIQHLLIAAPILIAAAVAMYGRRVQQVPKQNLATSALLFFFFVGLSGLFAANKSQSFELWFEWLSYGAAMFAVVMNAGRQKGPLVILGSISAATFLMAVYGVQEYGGARRDYPSWRIFAHTENPNVAAVFLLVGILLLLCLTPLLPRLMSLFGALACGMMLFALLLTGSKGGTSLGLPLGLLGVGVSLVSGTTARRIAFLVVAAVCGVAVFGMFYKNVAWGGLSLAAVYLAVALLTQAETKRYLPYMAVPFVICAAFLFLLKVTTPARDPASLKLTGPAASPIMRVESGGDTQDQSATFRLNLWRSTLSLIRQRPFTGYGLGSFAVESSRSGRVTPTVLAHQSYLQLWAEGGVIPFLLFFYMLGAWTKGVWKGREALPAQSRLELAGVIAAVVAVLAHSLIDSDLYYYGIGIVFFVLLGVGLLLAADAVTPELAAPNIRKLLGTGTVGLLCLLLVCAYLDTVKSFARSDMAKQDLPTLKSDLDSIAWASSFDGEVNFDRSWIADSPSAQIDDLKRAFALDPRPRYGRALSDAQLRAGDTGGAVTSLLEALDYDPDNLPSLFRLANLYQNEGDISRAVEIAQRLVDVEKSPYFQVRSQPQIVPTQTYQVRLTILAPNTADPKAKADLLAAGVRGILEYARLTVPAMMESQGDPTIANQVYGTVDEAKKILSDASAGAAEAAALYRKLGDLQAAQEMDAAQPRLKLPAPSS